MTAAQTLLECGMVIANQGRWCQHKLAVNKSGREIDPKSHGAIKWHACGIPYAVLKVKVHDFNNKKLDEVGECLAHLSKSAYILYKMTESQVNDQLGHEATVEMFRHAVRRARVRA